MTATVWAAPPARAAVTLVASPGGSGMACTTASPCSLTEARSQAASAPGSDIALTAGTYSLSASLEIGGFTIRPLTAGERPVLRFTGASRIYANNPSARIQGLRIESLDLGATAWAVDLLAGIAERLEVVAGGTSSANGVLLQNGATLSDSTVWTTSPFGSALNTGNGGGTIRNVTALATGANSTGFFTNDSYVSGPATITIQNTILRGERADLEAYSSTPAEPIAISTDHSNYVNSSVTGPHATFTDLGGRQTTAPVFVDAAAGNLRQAASSPTRDAGAPVAGLSATALDGQARVQGSAPDIGADEFAVAPSTLTPGALKRKPNGTARLTLTASAPGTATVTGPRIKPVTITFGASGAAKAKIKLTKAGKRRLARTGKVRTTLSVTWSPTSGAGTSPDPVTVTLKKRKR